MSKTKHLALICLAIMAACSSDDTQDSDAASDSYEVTALLTCSETTNADSENSTTIYCEQPENGMTPEMVEPYIAALITCGVNWQEMQGRRLNEYVFSDIVSNYFKSDPNENSVLIPIEPLEVFTLPVKNFRSGFGKLPGFMVTFDSEYVNIRNTLNKVGFQLDQCNEQGCELAISETETVILQDKLFGCAYPLQN